MNKSREDIVKMVLTGTSVAIGFGLKKLLKEGWVKAYDEDPPGEKLDQNIDWPKFILWTILSGLLLRIVKVAIKRSMAVVIEKEDLLD